MMRLSLISGLFLVLFSALPAQAGFEWTPAPSVAASSQNTEPLMPAIPPVEVQVIDSTAPQGLPAAPVAQTMPVITEIPAAPSSDGTVFAEAIGFGEDLPLVLALRQVVPPRYAFAFDPSVDQGARVNWNGGKPWNIVLAEALNPIGLGTRITETTVHIVPAAMTEAPVPEPVTTPAAPPLAAEAAPMPVFPPEIQTEKQNQVREVYIRRHEKSSHAGDSNSGMNETLSPAAGGPEIEDEEPSFWNSLGFSDDDARKEDADATGPVSIQAPLLTAPQGDEYKEAVMQPVSLSGETERPASTVMLKTAKHQGVMDPYDVRFWQAEKGDSLKNVLATWSESAGVELYWISTEDYMLPEAVRLHGNYTEALMHVLAAYGEGGDRPQGRLHPNLPTGPSVLIIESAQN